MRSIVGAAARPPPSPRSKIASAAQVCPESLCFVVVIELQRSVGRSARFASRGWRVYCAKVSRECPLLAFTRLANAHAAIATMFESVEAVPIAKVAALVAKAAASGRFIFE